MGKYIVTVMVASLLTLASKATEVSGHGVILMYHHVSESTPPSTSISVEKFAQHMRYLAQHHRVIPLQDMVEKLRAGETIPDKSVAITFDDGFDNIFINAHPILLEFDFPYTIFINPAMNGQQNHQLTWEQVKQMQQQGVTFANHSSVHAHLLTGSDEEGWLARTLADIEQAEATLLEKTGTSSRYLAYPYGEYNQTLEEAIELKGYIGFGQHSGAVSKDSNYGALPRFPAAGIYANLATLKVKLSSLAMPVKSKQVLDPQLDHQERMPRQTIQVDLDDMGSSQLACYYSGEPLPLIWQDDQFSFTVPKALPVGRSRINCTAPSRSRAGRFYWYSQPWFVPTENGKWID